MSPISNLCAAGVVFAAAALQVRGEAEVYPWGGLRGVRLEGERVALTTGIRAVHAGETIVGPAKLEKLAWPQLTRSGEQQIVTGSVLLDPNMPRQVGAGISAGPLPNTRVVYEDASDGTVKVEVAITPLTDSSAAGVYYYFHLPAAEFPGASVERTFAPAAAGKADSDPVTSLRISSPHRQLTLRFDRPRVVSTAAGNGGLDVTFPIAVAPLRASVASTLSFAIVATGDLDRTPVNLSLDFAHPGSPFAGVGGNFRIQNRVLDPPQVQYYLDHLRVAWGRVNVPLDLWQPREDVDPAAEAAAGRVNEQVRVACAMAQTLSQRKIPLVLTVWAAPLWALGPLENRPPGGGGGQARHVNPAKWNALCRSIASYLEHLKANYDTEPDLFSFNETDIGYDVLATPQEHAEMLKRVGGYFAQHGIRAKLILGDTGDPTGIGFIDAALADPEALHFVGAVSYHSWRGGTDDQYTRWGAAAKKLGVPLLIGEGGIDADAYRYPALLLEPWYALVEIGEYIDICRVSQPLSILQWQLTENYSCLRGGRDGQPLEPAQRFWDLKQLDLTPVGAQAIPVHGARPGFSACAYRGADGTLVMHIVNDGAARRAVLTGLPSNVTAFRAVVTDARRGLVPIQGVPVSAGKAQVEVDAMSYTTLLSVP